MNLDENDLEIVSGCAAAHPDRRGGQHVAMSCSGVMVIHKPTGIAVRCLDERSQYKNKQAALTKLAEILTAMYPPALEQCWCGVVVDPHNDCCRAGHRQACPTCHNVDCGGHATF